jgi:hypothetical protein
VLIVVFVDFLDRRRKLEMEKLKGSINKVVEVNLAAQSTTLEQKTKGTFTKYKLSRFVLI